MVGPRTGGARTVREREEMPLVVWAPATAAATPSDDVSIDADAQRREVSVTDKVRAAGGGSRGRRGRRGRNAARAVVTEGGGRDKGDAQEQ